MTKYTTETAIVYGGYWDYEDETNGSRECIVQDNSLFSGLYDSDGNALYRVPNKIGFI